MIRKKWRVLCAVLFLAATLLLLSGCVAAVPPESCSESNAGKFAESQSRTSAASAQISSAPAASTVSQTTSSSEVEEGDPGQIEWWTVNYSCEYVPFEEDPLGCVKYLPYWIAMNGGWFQPVGKISLSDLNLDGIPEAFLWEYSAMLGWATVYDISNEEPVEIASVVEYAPVELYRIQTQDGLPAYRFRSVDTDTDSQNVEFFDTFLYAKPDGEWESWYCHMGESNGVVHYHDGVSESLENYGELYEELISQPVAPCEALCRSNRCLSEEEKIRLQSPGIEEDPWETSARIAVGEYFGVPIALPDS